MGKRKRKTTVCRGTVSSLALNNDQNLKKETGIDVKNKAQDKDKHLETIVDKNQTPVIQAAVFKAAENSSFNNPNQETQPERKEKRKRKRKKKTVMMETPNSLTMVEANDSTNQAEVKTKPLEEVQRMETSSATTDHENITSGLKALMLEMEEMFNATRSFVDENIIVKCGNRMCPWEEFCFFYVPAEEKSNGNWFCPQCRGKLPHQLKSKRALQQELLAYIQKMESR